MKSWFNKKRVIYVLIFFAVAAAAFLSNPNVYRFFTESETSKLRFRTGTENRTAVYGRELLLVNNEGITAVDSRGREAWSISCVATSPVVEVKNKYIMLADISGRTVNVYRRDKLEFQIKTEKEILSAKLNKNGYIAAVTDEAGYKGVLTVYNRRGREIFKWHSGTGYIGDAELLPDNGVVVSQIMTDRDKVYSRILIPDMKDGGEAKCTAELEGLVMKLECGDGGDITAISDSALCGFKKNGKKVFEVSFEGRQLLQYDISNRGNMVLAFEDSLGNTVLESYSSKGTLRGNYSSGEKLGAFAVSGECILAAGQQGVVRLTPEGKVKGKTEVSHDVQEIAIFAGRKRFITIGGGGAELLKVK